MPAVDVEPGPLVMVAEDSGTVRRLVARILLRAGFRVVEAVDGLDALTCAVLERPDVALLDVDMPGCDGIEVLRRLKSTPGVDHLQVLMLTAIDDVDAVAEALALGALDYVRKPCHPAELVARVRRAAGVAIEADQLRRRSTTDELTGLPNRRGLRLLLEAASRPSAPLLSVAIVDADHFKRVNDEWGHEVGDLVLQEIARRLAAAWPTVQIGRWGGEEFLGLYPATDAEDALAVADRLRCAVAVAPIEAGRLCPPLELTVSIGVATTRHGSPLDVVVARADEALYEAKAGGRNTVVHAASEARH